MPRAGERRLRQLEAQATAAALEAAGRRGVLRFYAGIAAEIRAAAAAAGIDAAAIGALQRGDEAAAELTALGETCELVLADQAIIDAGHEQWLAQHPGGLGGRDGLAAQLAEAGNAYRDGSTPEPADSILQWYAWALVQPETPRSEPAA